MNNDETRNLNEIAKKIRLLSLEGIYCAKSGHPGGSLSMAEIVAYLYFHEMNIDPEDPKKPDRDRFVLSKGHAAPALYAALALRGYFPTEEIKNLRRVGSMLQGHPDSKKIPGIDMSTGSLGQGLSAALGMAFGNSFNVYCVVGDGELQEGQIWEAVMLANHYNVTNLYVFVDYNKVQLSGNVADISKPMDIAAKFEAFGWYATEIDGHSIDEIDEAVTQAKRINKPCVIVCDTVKGKGVSFMEGNCKWHGNAPNDEQYAQAVEEIRNA